MGLGMIQLHSLDGITGNTWEDNLSSSYLENYIVQLLSDEESLGEVVLYANFILEMFKANILFVTF